jgi:hypothetical protein
MVVTVTDVTAGVSIRNDTTPSPQAHRHRRDRRRIIASSKKWRLRLSSPCAGLRLAMDFQAPAPEYPAVPPVEECPAAGLA